MKALTASVLALALAGCGDPLDKVEHIQDVDLAEDQPAAAVVTSPEELDREGGILSALFAGTKPDPDPQTAPAPDAATPPADPEKRRGLLGLFRGNAVADDTVQTASLTPDATGRGIFGTARPAGIDMLDVPVGAVLPYGSVARVCDATPRNMGRKIDKAPARGSGFTLYDSEPQSTGARTFYVTGFADGCARQFTAALAMFGAPSMHEQLRYGRPAEDYPYSDTDEAYEKVKRQICRVGKRKPCGSAIRRLERDTVFVSTYENFGNNARWADILLHDGQVMAAAIKTP